MVRTLITITCYLLLLDGTATGHPFGHGFQVQDKVVAYKIRSNQIKYKQRSVDILIDEKDFSVENLKLLMNSLFMTYPTPKRLSVFVATNTSQFDLAEYVDPSKRPGAFHPYGGLYRQKDKDFLRYKFPNEKLQTIIIKENTVSNKARPQL